MVRLLYYHTTEGIKLQERKSAFSTKEKMAGKWDAASPRITSARTQCAVRVMFIPDLRRSLQSEGTLLSTGIEFFAGKRCLPHPDALFTSLPAHSPLSGVEFLGEMYSFLHSRALLPLIPLPPFSPCGRRGVRTS